MDRIARAFTEAVSAASAEVPVSKTLCAVCLSMLPVTGVVVSLISAHGYREMWCASDARAAKVEAAQWTVGEGPCFDAYGSGDTVLVADLRAPDHSGWPIFTPQALADGVGAVFAFPLRVGAIYFGAMSFYRDSPGALSRTEAAEVSSLSYVVANMVLAHPGDGQQDAQSPPESSEYSDHTQVHQATGMIMIQLGISADTALVRLRARAFAEGRTIIELAGDVVRRRLRFGGDTP